MKLSVLLKTSVFVAVLIVFGLIYADDVTAEMGYVTGNVYTRHPVTNAKVYLPGVKIYRQDGDGAIPGDTWTCEDWVYHKTELWPWMRKREAWNCSQNPSCVAACDQHNANGDSDPETPGVQPWTVGNWSKEPYWGTNPSNWDSSWGHCRLNTNVPTSQPTEPMPTMADAAQAIANHCRADHGNVLTTSQSDGSYYMGNGEYLRYDPNIWDQTPPPDEVIEQNDPPPSNLGYIYGYQRLCPSTDGRGLGPYTRSAPAVDMKSVEYRSGTPPSLNFCGFSCLENPHHMKAYFPDNYQIVLSKVAPWVAGFDPTDPKGGGSWMTRFDDMQVGYWGYTSRTIADSHATTNWPDPLYGTYEREEFYEVYIGNNMGYDGFDFEWIPPGVVGIPPIIETVDPSGDSPWIGTLDDGDNGLACEDNNPYYYRLNARDPNGSYDIDQIELALAKGTQLNDGDQRDWPLKIMFAQKWAEDAGREYADFNFFVRDAEVQGDSSDRCLNQNGTPVDREPSGYNKVGGDPWSVGSNPSTLTAKTDPTYKLWCYGVDGHSWDPTQRTTATIGSRNYDIYYITGDIVVDGDEYSHRLIGSNSAGNWQYGTYVAYERAGGTHVKMQLAIAFDGGSSRAENAASPWTGEYRNIWWVKDLTGREDQTANSHPNEIVRQFSGQYHHIFGKTKIDLKAPEINLDTPNAVGGNDVEIPWYATDTGGSKLSRVWGDLESSIGSAPFIWDISGLSVNRRPGSDYEIATYTFPTLPANPVNFAGFCQDGSCNISPNTNNSSQLVLYDPWMITRGGLVYSRDAINTLAKDLDGTEDLCPDSLQGCSPFANPPWNFERQEVALSTEWLATNASLVGDHLRNRVSATTFPSEPNYTDLNNQLWFDILVEKANRNIEVYPERYTVVNGLSALSARSSNHCTNADKPCVIKTAGPLTISNEFRCDRQTFIFVYGGLTVNRKIIADGAPNGCIFVTTGNVVLNPIQTAANSDQYPEYDEIDAFIISDGNITINRTVNSAEPYGIKVWGALLAFGEVGGKSLTFDRTLKNAFNQSQPSYIIHHDARYFDIARKVVDDDKDAYKEEVGQDAY